MFDKFSCQLERASFFSFFKAIWLVQKVVKVNKNGICLKVIKFIFVVRKVLKAYYFSNQGKKYVAGVHRITINLIFRNYLCGKKSGSYTSLYELHSCKSFAIQHWFSFQAKKEQHKYLNPWKSTGCPLKVGKCKIWKFDSPRHKGPI